MEKIEESLVFAAYGVQCFGIAAICIRSDQLFLRNFLDRGYWIITRFEDKEGEWLMITNEYGRQN